VTNWICYVKYNRQGNNTARNAEVERLLGDYNVDFSQKGRDTISIMQTKLVAGGWYFKYNWACIQSQCAYWNVICYSIQWWFISLTEITEPMNKYQWRKVLHFQKSEGNYYPSLVAHFRLEEFRGDVSCTCKWCSVKIHKYGDVCCCSWWAQFLGRNQLAKHQCSTRPESSKHFIQFGKSLTYEKLRRKLSTAFMFQIVWGLDLDFRGEES